MNIQKHCSISSVYTVVYSQYNLFIYLFIYYYYLYILYIVFIFGPFILGGLDYYLLTFKLNI